MGLLSLNLPVIGQSSATEDQKVRDALAAIQTDYNGNLTDANISATAGIQESKLATGVNGLARGAFYAYRTTAVTPASGAVIVFDAELYDVSAWFDTATGIFTPQVAGYYRFSWAVALLSTTASMLTTFQKNGVDYARGNVAAPTAWSSTQSSVGSANALANGTTDNFRVTATNSVGAVAVQNAAPNTFFCGELIGRS